MKKYCLSLVLLILSLNLIAQKRIIINPFYEVTTSGISHIDKIELNDKETRIYLRCTFVPYWWVKFSRGYYLEDADTGEKYFATAMTGGEFDKEIYMPASGDSSFVLIFPKLKETVKRLNYVEDDPEDRQVIFGLSLDPEKHKEQTSAAVPETVKTWIEAELARAKSKALVNYSSKEFFSRDTARLIGYIKGYDPRLGFKTGIIYSSNEITNEDFPVTVTIHEDGRFEAAIPMNHPKYTAVVFRDNWIKFYIEPGQTLAMYINWDEFLMADRLRNIDYSFKEIEFDGPAARINKELSAVSIKTFDYKEKKRDSTETPEHFKARTMSDWKQSEDQLELDMKDKNFTDQAMTILRNEISISYAMGIFEYVSPIFNNGRTYQVSSSYYDFLKQVNLNEQSIIIASQFSFFVNRFEYSEPLRHQASQDAILFDYFQVHSKFTYDIARVRSFKSSLEGFKNKNSVLKVNAVPKDEARSFLTAREYGMTPFLIDESERLFQKAFPDVPKPAYDLPAGKGTEIFRKIIDPFKGKLLIVDFWATTCAPCVYNIKESKEIRQTYKDSKELEFIFLTAEDQSPLTRYNEFVKEQELAHTYRLSVDDFLYLRELFRFNGIPRYVVINKEGQVLDDNFSMYSFESKLQNLLTSDK